MAMKLKTTGTALGLCMATMLFADDNRPNVILIYADDLGTLDLGCYGADDLYTPNIDSLASAGVKFSQFYAAPVSSASRASLMTGQFTRHAGLTGNAGTTGLPLDKETIADVMGRNGYNTACIGKWHLGSNPEYAPNARGFDYFWGFLGGCIDSYSHFFYWSGPNKHDLWENGKEIFRPGKFFINESLNQVKDYINNEADSGPFFLYWAINLPHYPLQPDAKWLEYYSGLENPRRMYAAFVSTMDDYVGRLMSFLKEKGLSDNTIVIFQSDNGHSTEIRSFGSGGWCGEFRGAKFSLFEGGIRVPAIISWPGVIPSGESRDQLAMNIDWFPTILELCGIEPETIDVDGKSLARILMNGNRNSEHDVLHFDFGDQWAVRYGRWKLMFNVLDVGQNNRKNTIEGYFLSNLEENISETENYADKYPLIVEKLADMREKYVESIENR